MKKTFYCFLSLVLMCTLCACENGSSDPRRVTLDWSGVTASGQPLTFTGDVWSLTMDESMQTITTNVGTFSHLPSGNSYGGTSWEGFTVSKVSADTVSPFACAAKGGLAGVGKPFMVGYYSSYYSDDLSSNMVTLPYEDYRLEAVWVCNSTDVLHVVDNGNAFARRFKDGDWLKLNIIGVKNDMAIDTVTYFLADCRQQGHWTVNRGWEKVDLSAIRDAEELAFTVEGSDVGEWGLNTPTYFCLDGLTLYRKK